MIDHANSRLTRIFPVLSNAASFIILSIAFLSLSGWIFSSPYLKSVLPNLVPMTPNTSICFILLSISLLNLTRHTALAARVRVACAGAVIAVGGLTLAQYISGLNLGIDSVLFAKAVQAYAIPFPGRMSPVSAVNFTLAGIAILMLGVRSCRNSGIVESIILLVGILGLMTIVGYVLNTPDLYNFKPFKPMALNTAVNFILVCLAAFLARLDCGLMSVVSSNTEGGMMARRMLLLVICVPVMLSWLAITGLRNNFYDVSLGISLLTMITIVVFTLLIWENALSLHMIDIKRMEVEVVLRENEDKYRVIFETTGTATAIFEEDKTISLANTEFEQVSGFSKAEIEGKKLWTEFVATEEDLARMQE
ncbi:MAG: PAS domain S-box protein, partial [Candidatus Omnitrophica bacterium]|nr:PAS domain S-box protein [Candidatus Omnitrophota bacterium]